MKKLFLVFAILMFSQNAEASGKYIIDSNHANITWFCEHFGYSKVSGTFGKVSGEIMFDAALPEQSYVKATIEISSLITAVPKLTQHLLGKDFFDAEKYPEAKFVSTSVKRTGKKTGIITGNLTMHGVTKQVKLKANFNKEAKNDFTKQRVVGFSAETTIQRSDFDIKYGLPGVADEVKILFEIEGIHEEDVLNGTN